MDLFAVWVFILGACIGSFLNVVVVRLPQKKSIVRPRSHCGSCKTPIPPWQNIPILSWLLLRGKCAKCGAKISVRYWIIEVLTALLFLAAYLRFGTSPGFWLRDLPFLSILVAVTFIDLEHRIIPDVLSLGGLVLGLATAWIAQDLTWMEVFLGAAFGFSLFYGFAWLYERMTGRSGLGGGDIKLLAMLGAFTGVRGVFFVMLASSVLGSVVGIALALVRREESVMKTSIPYGPFLVIGAISYYLLSGLEWLPFMIRI